MRRENQSILLAQALNFNFTVVLMKKFPLFSF